MSWHRPAAVWWSRSASSNRRLYRVHWAGEHSAEGASDCGSEADLLINRYDLQLLINAVGGPGVEHHVTLSF